MLYAILCYGDERTVRSLDKEQDEQLMKKLSVVHDALIAEGKLGPHFRLHVTGTAKTLRAAGDQVLDGPFAETKEQLLGLYVVECANLDEALDTAHRLEVERKVAHVAGSLEVRPILQYFPGNSPE
jgi:hypothetical protein